VLYRSLFLFDTYSAQAYSVPLDIKFYSKPTVTSVSGFPITFAGMPSSPSTDRSTGNLQQATESFGESDILFFLHKALSLSYLSVPFPLGFSTSAQGYSFMIQATNIDTCPGSCTRPVGLDFGKDDKLYVSSDSSGEVSDLE